MDYKELMKNIDKLYWRAGLIGYINGVINANINSDEAIKLIKIALCQYNLMNQ